MKYKRHLLFLLFKEREYALFSIDNLTNNVLICFQGNPHTIEGKKSRVIQKTREEARIEWKQLINDGWEQFSKGIITGAVMQRINIWIKLREINPDQLQKQLLAEWKTLYDEVTGAYTCEIDSQDFSELKGFELNRRKGAGYLDGGTLFYIPGTIPRQRGKRMR
tara:strand:- start:149 stop:640 length:492 start_codon:yes stop_codon:yes gene_type:complete